MEIKRFSNSTDVVFSIAAKDDKKENIIISYCKKLWKILEKLPSMCLSVRFWVLYWHRKAFTKKLSEEN